jgi:hypothetical protein
VTNWKYVDEKRKVVHRVRDDGSHESCLADIHPPYLAWLAEGNTPLPPDPPSKAELDAPVLAELEALDIKSIPYIRAWISKQADAPKELAALEDSAALARSKLTKG